LVLTICWRSLAHVSKTDSGGTDHVWFYDVDADGWSLDDKRTPLLPEEKLGPVPKSKLTDADHAKNNLPDIIARFRSLAPKVGEGRGEGESKRARTAQSFLVPKADIAAQGYDLSLNRYKEVVHEEIKHASPKEILKNLAQLESEIQTGMKQLEGMLE
jgi:type I restriction enzyme M protein